MYEISVSNEWKENDIYLSVQCDMIQPIAVVVAWLLTSDLVAGDNKQPVACLTLFAEAILERYSGKYHNPF